MKKLTPDIKRDLSIGRQNSRNLAMEFLPEKLRGTEEGYEMWKTYRDKFFREYVEWRINKLEK